MDSTPRHSVHTPFNGVVKVGDISARVIDGVVKFNGQTFHVSNNGEMVVNDKLQVVGYIKGNVFYPMDAAHAAKLRAHGVAR